MRFQAILLSLVLILGAAACGPTGVAVTAGSKAAVASQQERGLGGAVGDLAIEAAILDAWFRRDHTWPDALTVDVYDGRAMVTGILPDADDRAEALRLVWAVPDVQTVYNEIQTDARGFMDAGRDTWIGAKLSARLTFDAEVRSINYQVTTVNGVVYILGHARTRAERDRVVDHARDIEHVRKVIPHILVGAETMGTSAP